MGEPSSQEAQWDLGKGQEGGGSGIHPNSPGEGSDSRAVSAHVAQDPFCTFPVYRGGEQQLGEHNTDPETLQSQPQRQGHREPHLTERAHESPQMGQGSKRTCHPGAAQDGLPVISLAWAQTPGLPLLSV